MKEHIELLYILQNRVEQGIVYFFDRSYSEHTELVYIPQNKVERGIVYFF